MSHLADVLTFGAMLFAAWAGEFELDRFGPSARIRNQAFERAPPS
jgi:hypothetical protein